MKENFLFYLLVFLLILKGNTQEKVYQTNLNSDDKFFNKDQSFSVSNQTNDDLLLVFFRKNGIEGILLDENFEEKKKFSGDPLPSKYKNFAGYQVTDQQYSVILTNGNKNKFGILKFDAKTGSFEEKTLDFKLNDERFLDYVVHKNNLFFLTVVTGTSTLNIYTFDQDFIPTKKTYSLRIIEHPNRYRPDEKRTLFSMLNPLVGSIGEHDFLNYSKVYPNEPNSLESTYKEIKLYHSGENLILSVDSNIEILHLFTLDLKTLNLQYKSFPKLTEKEDYKKNNSLVYNNYLFFLSSSPRKFKFQIYNLETTSFIKEYSLSSDEIISFKNSPIIEENGAYSDYREMEKAKKFLRKISVGELAVSVHKKDNCYTILMGGVLEIMNSGGFGFPNMNSFGESINIKTPDGKTLNIPNLAYQPFARNYYSYNYSNRVTYIKCLFDNQFNHIDGEIPLTYFDSLKEFEEDLIKPKLINIFKHSNSTFYGYLDSDSGNYSLYKFE